MYATYNYKAGSTVDNIIADITMLLTGTTDKTTLSSDCVQAGTEILTSASVAGWTLFDDVSATRKIFRAPWHADNGSGYNYLEVNGNTAGGVSAHAWESWNSGTHVGTNQTYAIPTTATRINTTTGGFIYVSAQAGHSFLIHSFANGLWGNTTSNGPDIIAEYPRRTIWDTNTGGYAPICRLYGNATGLINSLFTRVVNASGADVLGGTAIGQAGNIFGSHFDSTDIDRSIPATTVPSADKSLKHMFLPIEVFNYTFGFLGGCLSTYSDAYYTTRAYGTNLDEVTQNGNTYVVWLCNTTRLAVRKG